MPSIERENDPPSYWEDICLEHTTMIPMENSTALSHEWQYKEDAKQEFRTTQRSNKVRRDLEPTSTSGSHQEPLF